MPKTVSGIAEKTLALEKNDIDAPDGFYSRKDGEASETGELEEACEPEETGELRKACEPGETGELREAAEPGETGEREMWIILLKKRGLQMKQKCFLLKLSHCIPAN